MRVLPSEWRDDSLTFLYSQVDPEVNNMRVLPSEWRDDSLTFLYSDPEVNNMRVLPSEWRDDSLTFLYSDPEVNNMRVLPSEWRDDSLTFLYSQVDPEVNNMRVLPSEWRDDSLTFLYSQVDPEVNNMRVLPSEWRDDSLTFLYSQVDPEVDPEVNNMRVLPSEWRDDSLTFLYSQVDPEFIRESLNCFLTLRSGAAGNLSVIITQLILIPHDDLGFTGCSVSDEEFMFALDAEELWHADFKAGKVVDAQPSFIPEHIGGSYEGAQGNLQVCRSNLGVDREAYKNVSLEKDPPSTPLLYTKQEVEMGEGNVLVCHVTGFYPAPVSFFWTKNGENVTEGTSFPVPFSPKRVPSAFSRLEFTPRWETSTAVGSNIWLWTSR
ncbi:RLA class II histocompatibility antigen DP alpha-1 chain [Dissostichus eleginoides]|uniref:RLA class II histocompatibility antigen DP alpha-1 chain n=1 Tax=Dissostichus eleginoides TaxID=100907 RepID=A0AAD9ERX4_DISEL|nr:RLA class II histocompatibility antigen DP alpha-1 chain [Dissostichus eleginoides]